MACIYKKTKNPKHFLLRVLQSVKGNNLEGEKITIVSDNMQNEPIVGKLNV